MYTDPYSKPDSEDDIVKEKALQSITIAGRTKAMQCFPHHHILLSSHAIAVTVFPTAEFLASVGSDVDRSVKSHRFTSREASSSAGKPCPIPHTEAVTNVQHTS